MSGSQSSTSNQSTTRSRLLMLSQSPSTSTTPVNPTKVPPPPLAVVDEKVFSRYSNTIWAETNKRKTDIAEHVKRLSELRKEAEHLEHTDWMFEPVEKLLGK